MVVEGFGFYSIQSKFLLLLPPPFILLCLFPIMFSILIGDFDLIMIYAY